MTCLATFHFHDANLNRKIAQQYKPPSERKKKTTPLKTQRPVSHVACLRNGLLPHPLLFAVKLNFYTPWLVKRCPEVTTTEASRRVVITMLWWVIITAAKCLCCNMAHGSFFTIKGQHTRTFVRRFAKASQTPTEWASLKLTGQMQHWQTETMRSCNWSV